MGLSHTLLINQFLGSNISFDFVDPSFLNRLIFKCLFPRASFHKSVNDPLLADKKFDFGLLCTPPSVRLAEFKRLRDLCDSVFIEKPVKVSGLRRSDSCGYVLLHHPCIRYLKKNFFNGNVVNRIDATVISNISFSGKTGGWRGYDKHLLITEFFSHLLSVVLYVGFDLDDRYEQIDVVNIQWVNNDNVNISLMFGGIPVNLSLEGARDVRKTSYEFSFTTDDYVISTDLYRIYKHSIVGNDEDASYVANITDISPEIFYLRGYEFSNQMESFLSGNPEQIRFDLMSKVIDETELKL